MWELLICTLFLILTTSLLAVEAKRYSVLRKALATIQNSTVSPNHYPSLSLIVAACNAADQLEQNLAGWLEQDYPAFEVIVINNGSSDQSAQTLKHWQKHYPQKLQVIHLTEAQKKKALAVGIASAKNDFLVFTDTDCRPCSKQWLRAMAKELLHHDVVLGFAPLEGAGFTGALSRWETWQTASLYFSALFQNRPYMGVGRNLAYRKSIFDTAGGFQAHQHLGSGDDDLFVQSAFQVGARIGAVISHESFVPSPAAANLKKWWRQKRRHFSTANYYSFKAQLRLSITAGLQILFYIFFGCVLILQWECAVAIFALRYFTHMGLAWPVAKHFKAKRELVIFPLFEFFWTLSAVGLQIQNTLAGKPKNW